MSEANNWKWISRPSDYVRNLVEELRVKGEERAAETLKGYVEEFHFKCAQNDMLRANNGFLRMENERLKAAVTMALKFGYWLPTDTVRELRKALGDDA